MIAKKKNNQKVLLIGMSLILLVKKNFSLNGTIKPGLSLLRTVTKTSSASLKLAMSQIDSQRKDKNLLIALNLQITI